MKVLYNKRLTNRVGHESCVVYREVKSEALTVEIMGWVLSREMGNSEWQTLLSEAECNNGVDIICESTLSPRGRRPHARNDVSCTEPGRSHIRKFTPNLPVRKGASRKPNKYGCEKSDKLVVPKKPSNKVKDRGDGGGKELG